jgi:Kef-type K+ transport system membrane component KefB
MLKLPKNLKFIAVTAWILFSRSYDAYCTHTLTPDLSKEANPLVTIGGVSSWSVLIVILSILTAYALFAFYVRTYRPSNLLPKEPGFSFSHFVGYNLLGKKEHWTSTLYKLPSDLERLNNYMGVVLTRCLVFAGIISTFMWILIHNSEYYKSVHTAPLVYTILIGGCFGIIYQWNKVEYKSYLLQEIES